MNYRKVKPGSIVEIDFDTYDVDGDPVTMTGLAVSDVTQIKVYKDGSTTERASSSGYALLDTDGIDFDGLTGVHGFTISLADNSTAGFWAAGSRYRVVVTGLTVDGKTVRFTADKFIIGYEGSILDTTIATLASQTSFTLTAGPAEDDALNGCDVVIHDIASAVQVGLAAVLDYTGSTKTVTLAIATTFTAAAGDNISVMPRTNLFSVNGTLASTAGTVDANITQIGGDTQSATDLKDFVDAGYDPATNKVQGVVLVDTTTTNTDMRGTDSAATAANLATVAGYLDTEIAAILADTNELQTDWTNGGRLDLLLDQTLADTNELQTDWANGGRLDVLLDSAVAAAVLAKQILGNKHTVVESPAGTFTITVRNDDDTATVRTIVYIPATGARTVS